MSKPTLEQMIKSYEFIVGDRSYELAQGDIATLEFLRELAEWRRRASDYRVAESKWSSIVQSSDSWKEQEPEWLAFSAARRALLEFKP